MAEDRRKDWGDRIHRAVKATALAVSLVLSGSLMAVTLGSGDHAWLAWIGLLPLFLAIRILRPIRATLAGALWGLSLFACVTLGAAPAIPPTLRSLILLSTIPAMYAGLAALASRAIGFNPVMLGLGWILVEVALKPLGLRHGLLAGSQMAGPHLQWLGRLLGYVFVAFLVACVNASLLAVLSLARASMPRPRSLVGLPVSGAACPLHSSLCIQLLTLCRAYPRAPPIPATLVR